MSPAWARIQVCEITLSVFRRVPVEILQEISIYATPSQPSLVTDQAPVSLAHVCRIWRKAVLGLPVLWKELYLEIDLHIPNDWAMHKYQCMVRNWYRRAGSHQLSLHLYTPSGTPEIQASRKSFTKFFLNPLRPFFLRI
ncbi:hypothetical protein CPB83DRAFT_407325 [Crepidotus variabilis]|uniref:F-box domain-containing protein n=1 Tax=Crepidotus variabilis TaxID=179855 RepID=A0A9P6ERX9_9AGAR|nr:hypothetical protein CPB83DRAFT_407325 [Crepidotus variabilis]